jgi:hypothetical protein
MAYGATHVDDASWRDDGQLHLVQLTFGQTVVAYAASTRAVEGDGLRRHHAAGSPEPLRAASSFGGRPRRGRSANQSIVGSLRIHLRTTSIGMTEPPHVSQRSWCQSCTTTAGIAGRSRLPEQLGQTADSSTPTSRAHSKQPSSTQKRMVRRDDGSRWPAAPFCDVEFVALGVDARDGSSGVM